MIGAAIGITAVRREAEPGVSPLKPAVGLSPNAALRNGVVPPPMTGQNGSVMPAQAGNETPATGAPGASSQASSLTDADAIRIARDFCQAIGEPVSGPGTIGPGMEEGAIHLPPTYWRPGRTVTFTSGSAAPNGGGISSTEVAVSDPGVVTRYFRRDNDDFRMTRPAGKGISKADAISRAEKIIAATHLSEQLAPPEAAEINMMNPPQYLGHQWIVRSRRQAQGVPFWDQQASVIMQAETGRIKALGVTMPTPPPAVVTARVTQPQAVEIARSYLSKQANNRESFKPLGHMTQGWITPQTHPTLPPINGVMTAPPQLPRSEALPPHRAWLVSLRGQTSSVTVPVDVASGEVVADGLMILPDPLRLPPSSALRPGRVTAVKPLSQPAPPPVVLRGPVVATVVGSPNLTPPAAGGRKYRLTVEDIYAPMGVLTELGYDPNDLGGNERSDQPMAQKLEQAARDGKLQLVPGPSAIVPENGVWGLNRVRRTICTDRIYWPTGVVPARIGMACTITPSIQADGRLRFKYDLGIKALADGTAWPDTGQADTSESSWSWGDEGAVTLLGGIQEEHYSWFAGGNRIRTEGIMHLYLIKAERA